jgi:CBS domain containing-hemolysin-like protein
VDASIELEDLESLLNIEFDTEEALTLGGFLIEQLERVPQAGEKLEYKNHHFKIQQANPKKVVQVLIFPHEVPEDLELEA